MEFQMLEVFFELRIQIELKQKSSIVFLDKSMG